MKKRMFFLLPLRLAALGAAAGCVAWGATEPGLLGWWRADQLRDRALPAVQGGPDGQVEGTVELITDEGPPALVFDGKRSCVRLGDRFSEAPLPERAFTIEAWVRVDKPLDWGGIIGAFQDNGSYERGWVLGFRGQKFSIALASEDAGRMTYLTSPRPFALRAWHHVAGTYDGRLLQLYVDGALAAKTTAQSGPVLYPPAAPYVLGAYQDDNEFYGLTGRIHEARVYARALDAGTLRARYFGRKDEFPRPTKPQPPFRALSGPFVEWIGPGRIAVSWTTRDPMPGALEFMDGPGAPRRLEDAAPARRHRFELDAIPRETICHYRIIGRNAAGAEWRSARYTFDSTFDYQLPPIPERPNPYPDNAWRQTCVQAAKRMLAELGADQGWCLVLGARDGCLAYELARRSRLNVVVIEADARRVAAIRRRLDQAGLHGIRASVIHLTGDTLPVGRYCANLIVSESALNGGTPPVNAAEAFRCLRPNGGLLLLGRPGADGADDPALLRAWFADGGMTPSRETTGGRWACFRRPPLAGAGAWSHLYGGPDNSSCSKGDLVAGDLQVLWWGDPGPRPMPDRDPRNPAAETINGRMYVQGDRILFGMDAYNGTILWSVQAPQVRRANMPRDCSNMAAADDYLYVAVSSALVGFNGQTGARELEFLTPPTKDGRTDDWGYVGVTGGLVIGSAVKPGSTYLGDDGEWYDGGKPQEVSVVTSEALFARDRHSGELRWTYENGIILNPTITVADGQVFFVESRNPAAKNAPTGRLLREPFADQRLVALDLATGRPLWEQRVDFSAARRVLFLSYGRNTLVAMGGAPDGYHLWVYDAPARSRLGPSATGPRELRTLLWKKQYPAVRDNHGGFLQHPLIIGDTLYCEHRAFALRTGRQLRNDVPTRRGCGIMVASNHSFFFRDHFHGQWDPVTNQEKEFRGIRGGCWINLIPGEGVLLGPETSSGCSCLHSIQTSVGYAPKATPKPARPKLQAALDADDVVLLWAPVWNNYVLERAFSLSAGAWEPVAGVGTGSRVHLRKDAPHAFFRLRQQ